MSHTVEVEQRPISVRESGHPRLHFTAVEIEELRAKVRRGVPAWLLSHLRGNCEGYLQVVDPHGDDWQRVRDMMHANWVCKVVLELTLAWVLTRDGRYRDLATGLMRRVVSWDTWFFHYEPTRSHLIACAAAFYDWMNDVLPEAERERLRERLCGETEQLAANIPTANPPTGCDSGPPRTFGPLGVAGLVLAGEHPAAEGWVQTAAQAMGTWMDNAFDADGGPYYSSDACYFTIGMSYLLSFLSALRRLTGVDLFAHPRLAANARYLLYRMEPQRDGHSQFGVYNRQPLMAAHPLGLAVHYQDGVMMWHYVHTQGPLGGAHRGSYWGALDDLVLSILWYREIPIVAPDRCASVARSKCYRGSGKAVMRTGFESERDVQFSLECGPYLKGWSHADRGSFILNAYGDRLIDDPGVWGGIDWSGSAQAHNVVLVDGVGPHPRGNGSITSFLHSDFADCLLADQTAAYRKNIDLTRAHRYVVFARPGYFVVIDDLHREAGIQVPEFLLHAGDSVHGLVKTGDSHYIMEGTNSDLHIDFVEPLGDLDGLFVTPPRGVMYAEHRLHRNPLGERDRALVTWYSFYPAARRLDGREEARFFTVLYPVEHGKPVPVTERIQDAGRVGIHLDGRDRILFNREGTAFAFPAGRTDAKVLFTQTGAAPAFLAMQCRSVSLQNQVELSADRMITVALRGTTGWITADRETTLKVRAHRPAALTVDQTEAELTPGGQATIGLPPGEHRITLQDYGL